MRGCPQAANALTSENRDEGTSDEVLGDSGASRLRHQDDHFLSALCRSLRDAYQMLGTDIDIITLQIITRSHGSLY